MKLLGQGFVLLSVLVMTCVLSGCMVGPNFRSPKPPIVPSYNASPLPVKTMRTPKAGEGGKSQTYVHNLDIPSEWWHLFKSPAINKLVRVGLMNSPNLRAATGALAQAQELLNAQIGTSLFPAITGQFSGTRQRFSSLSVGGGGAGSAIFNVLNATVNISYTLDVFGGARRQIEALAAQVDYQEFQLIAAYITLTTNIITSAVTAASLQQQIKSTITLIKFQSDQLRILRSQYRLGGIALTDVLTQETLVAQTVATLSPLEKQLSQTRHALAVLVGVFPNQPLPEINLDKLHLPRTLPVSLPSTLVRQRPDVRASEALLHAAMAQIGVATANLFPQFTLTGNYGFTATTLGNLFKESSKIWSMMGSIAQPIYQGGALLAQRRAAIAAYVQAEAQYQQTVLQAFQDVADTLRALDTDARALRAEKAAELSAYNSMLLAKQQYLLGGASYLSLLIAQRQYQLAVISRIRAQANRYTDTAALFLALGGGWWNRTCTPSLKEQC